MFKKWQHGNHSEAATQSCSYEKAFSKYAATLQENTLAEVQFAAYFQNTFS